MNQRQASAAELIRSGGAILGIEFGSTRIKASLIAPDTTPLASGSHAWENQLKDGVWTYDMEDVWKGLAACYASLVQDVRARYSLELKTVAAMGFSGMMHGYVALDRRGEAAGAVPHLAEQHHRPGLRRADPAPRLRRAAALEHRPPVPVDPGGAAARAADRPPHHAGRLRPLEAHRRAQDGRGRGLGHVPHRPAQRRLGRRADGQVRRPHRAAQARLEAPGHPPRRPARRPPGREAHRRGREAARPVGQASGRHPAVSSRGRRGHGHGRHQRRAPALGERLRGHLGVRHDRAGEEPVPRPRGDRHRGHARRKARGHGPLQQRVLRPRRLDRPLRPGGQGAGRRGHARRPLRQAPAAGGAGRSGRGRAPRPSTTSPAST